MSLRVPYFGLLSKRTPMSDLLKHYEQIAKGMRLIEDSLACYIEGADSCPEFKELTEKVDAAEEAADKIKRSIRNHMPRGLLMPVDKTIFINYTRLQDNILDEGQDALNWLLMRSVTIPEEFQKNLIFLLDEVNRTVTLLKPALESTIGFIHGTDYDRQATKESVRVVRKQHKKAHRQHAITVSEIYNSEMEFKDIHQLIHFSNCLNSMSHNTEGCADLLRAMIAR